MWLSRGPDQVAVPGRDEPCQITPMVGPYQHCSAQPRGRHWPTSDRSRTHHMWGGGRADTKDGDP